MFQLTLQITDETIKQALLRLAQQRSSEVSEVIMMAIQDFITQNEPLDYEKLDPLVYSTVINRSVPNENLDDVKPFAEVNNTTQYVQMLRQRIWQKEV